MQKCIIALLFYLTATKSCDIIQAEQQKETTGERKGRKEKVDKRKRRKGAKKLCQNN